MQSYRSLVFSPINLPEIKPRWFSWIRTSITDLNLRAMTPDSSLYVTFRSEIGRQFLRFSLGLLPFCKRDIMPRLWLTVNFPLSKDAQKDRCKKSPISTQKNWKNSAEKPSTPGDLPFLQVLRSFLEHCTLTNKAVGTIWRDLSKPPQRRQGPDPRPLWLLVGTPLVLGPELASRRAEHSHSGGCHYIFLILFFITLHV